MALDLTQATDEQRARFATILHHHGAEECPKCAAPIPIEGVTAMEGSTEAGTGCNLVSVACYLCGAEVQIVHSWHPLEVDDIDELLGILEKDWR